jgi:hypothetical protein
LVVPVIVVERAWVGTGMRRSAALVRRRWGDAIGALFGPRAFAFVFVPLCVLVMGSQARLSPAHAIVLAIVLLWDVWLYRTRPRA